MHLQHAFLWQDLYKDIQYMYLPLLIKNFSGSHLLQHDGLLLLEQSLELLRGEDLLLEDLLHLLRCDHLGTHHGHRHWNLDKTGKVKREMEFNGCRNDTRSGKSWKNRSLEMCIGTIGLDLVGV